MIINNLERSLMGQNILTLLNFSRRQWPNTSSNNKTRTQHRTRCLENPQRRTSATMTEHHQTTKAKSESTGPSHRIPPSSTITVTAPVHCCIPNRPLKIMKESRRRNPSETVSRKPQGPSPENCWMSFEIAGSTVWPSNLCDLRNASMAVRIDYPAVWLHYGIEGRSNCGVDSGNLKM